MQLDTVKKYVAGLMADDNGTPSSKRLVVFFCVGLLAIGFIANLFWQYKVEEFMYNSITYIVIGGMGFTGVEKFAPKLTNQGDDTNGAG